MDGLQFKMVNSYSFIGNRLGKICFVLRIIQQIMHLEIVCSLYYAYFHSALRYDIIFWGSLPL